MRKVISSVALAVALAASASSGVAQGGRDVNSGKSKPVPAAAEAGKSASKVEKGAGKDCSPQRAGVRCSRPKPKKPWFFGD